MTDKAYDRAIRWWDAQQARDYYPFGADAPTPEVRPETADKFGINRSVVFNRGIRTYAFKDETARDAFCDATGAVAI
jgi:hypothetical protein